MLLLVVTGLLLGSLLVLCVKKNRESLLLAGMCLSLTLYLLGLMIFIAKKSGISQELELFLFFSRDIRTWIQYRFITLGQLGYLIAIGRHLYPLCLLEMAMQYSMISVLWKYPVLRRLAVVLPAASLVLYWPGVYRWLVDFGDGVRSLLYNVSYVWVVGYVFLALFLLGYEFFSITMSFSRRRFAQIMVCLVSLSALYLLYCGQDPGQVYRFYSYDYIWIRGVGYLQHDLSIGGYVVLVVCNAVCGVLGLGSLLRYTRDSFASDRDDIALERKFDVARTGASVFVHSIKNQLLANRVLYKRIRSELQKEVPDLERLRTYTDALGESNELLISRSEELYRTVKAKSVRLVPVDLGRLEEVTLGRFHQKYPEGRVEAHMDHSIQVLADENYLSEALYNLLTNGWEAAVEAGHDSEPVELWSHQERLYTVLEVRDRGTGIPPGEIKHIFEPFYSGKNSNFNWGMGLYHVRTIVRSHLGSLRVENRPEGGAAFYILLPRYGAQRAIAKRGKDL
ncbi:MAG TPA: HAMP domain-containing histidine kinase [Candidatus Intestinimonas pullistercoris]|uniref:histidine kinase n=1 Tax=Candidatus Intestinimonas pullistercoris TaxID=2838623 RepID=A0A9D2P1B1_9FIRM|nr:HAMP domain-containing histidine kinase [Candidatus Intestinimonas pullistercoris]